jgi:hypothetical protein
LQGVSYEFISGVCDPSTPLLGIINSAAGSAIEGTVKAASPASSATRRHRPGDSPIAEAIETALAQISIAGSVGSAVRPT